LNIGIPSQPSRDLVGFSFGQSPRAFKGHSILWNAASICGAWQGRRRWPLRRFHAIVTVHRR
jgi:hypothetical protein